MTGENEYRVLWTDAAGEGRFTSILARSEASAAWKAAILTDSQSAEFVAVEKITPPRGTKP